MPYFNIEILDQVEILSSIKMAAREYLDVTFKRHKGGKFNLESFGIIQQKKLTNGHKPWLK